MAYLVLEYVDVEVRRVGIRLGLPLEKVLQTGHVELEDARVVRRQSRVPERKVG